MGRLSGSTHAPPAEAAHSLVQETGVASHVTKLNIQLRRLRIDNENALALFYDYSPMEVPSGNGFSINTGLGTLSCQVNGMTLEYFGPPKSQLQN